MKIMKIIHTIIDIIMCMFCCINLSHLICGNIIVCGNKSDADLPYGSWIDSDMSAISTSI